MIAQFARSSRTWTAVALGLVLALALVALTDAVRAEEPKITPAPASQGAPGASPELQAERAELEKVFAQHRANLQALERKKAGTTQTASESPTDEEIAQSDPTVREQRYQLARLEEERQRTSGQVGEKHPSVVALDAQIKQARDLVATSTDRRRLQMMRPTKLKAGDLVAVSIMDLVGPGIETVKTARIDGDGTIGLPYVGEVKAAGLSPRELEKAVAKAYKTAGVIENAVAAVSMPERGESHQIARVRQEQPAAVDLAPRAAVGFAPPQPGVEADSPAMMGMSAPAAPEEDAATKALLNRKLPELKLDGVPLAEVVDFLRDTVKVNVFVNWRALEAHGVDRSAPVTIRLNDVALRDALTLIMRDVSQGAAAYTVENGVIVIDGAHHPSPKPSKPVTEAYNVADLLGDGTPEQIRDKRDQLQQVIMNNMRSHMGLDGTFSISPFDQRLIITAPENVHREVKELLKMLGEQGGAKPLRPTTAPAVLPLLAPTSIR